jgi:N-dimethylarginine dimethylaminohydrolase
MKQTWLLGSPNFYEANTHNVDKHTAEKQWQRLKSHIEAHNITVKVVPGSNKEVDSVYITDAAIIVNDFAIMARFHKPSRRGEEKILAEYLKKHFNLRLHYLPEEEGVYFEGGGDTRWSHGGQHVWFGYGGGRSTLKGIEAVAKILKEELGPKCPYIHTLRIIDRKTFHLDLAFLPLPNGRALYYPTLSPTAIKQIETIFGHKNVVKVPNKYFFACNSVWIDEKTLLTPKLPYDDFSNWMHKATNMKLDQVNVSEFQKGNGSIQCMILRMCHF